MSRALPMTAAQSIVYGFVTKDVDGPDISRWVDRAAVSSGDSVSVLLTFFRNRLARIDVFYPPATGRENCPICAALRQQFGPPTAVDTTSLIRRFRWSKWTCCELQLIDARLTLSVSYVSLAARKLREKEENEALVRSGRMQLK